MGALLPAILLHWFLFALLYSVAALVIAHTLFLFVFFLING